MLMNAAILDDQCITRLPIDPATIMHIMSLPLSTKNTALFM